MTSLAAVASLAALDRAGGYLGALSIPSASPEARAYLDAGLFGEWTGGCEPGRVQPQRSAERRDADRGTDESGEKLAAGFRRIEQFDHQPYARIVSGSEMAKSIEFTELADTSVSVTVASRTVVTAMACSRLLNKGAGNMPFCVVASGRQPCVS